MKRRDFLKLFGATTAAAAIGKLDLGDTEAFTLPDLALTDSGLLLPPTLEENTDFARTVWALDKTGLYDPGAWRIVDRIHPYSQAWAERMWGMNFNVMERVTAIYQPSRVGFEVARTKRDWLPRDDFEAPDISQAQVLMSGATSGVTIPGHYSGDVTDYSRELPLIVAEMIPQAARELGLV
jgi:hypothetical protein